MVILIPSYEPTKELINLVKDIKARGSFDILIVDDGSGASYRDIFLEIEKLGCTVLYHETNLGKGCALKTGFKHIKNGTDRTGVVCADSDGQHHPWDIIKIANNVYVHPRNIILGYREFTGKIPIRSKFGNIITRKLFSYVAGIPIKDTQTGLRGYSYDMLDWLVCIPGNRFEYEMNMLYKAKNADYNLYEIPIKTIYYKNNPSSHFRVFRDSYMVFKPLLKFCVSSLTSAMLDFILVLLITKVSNSLLLGVIISRIISSTFNYILNRNLVFIQNKKNANKNSALKYFTLVLIIMIFNYILIFSFNKIIGIPLFIAKILTEVTIFLFSYWSQRKFIFAY